MTRANLGYKGKVTTTILYRQRSTESQSKSFFDYDDLSLISMPIKTENTIVFFYTFPISHMHPSYIPSGGVWCKNYVRPIRLIYKSILGDSIAIRKNKNE